jgi:transposase-like protein
VDRQINPVHYQKGRIRMGNNKPRQIYTSEFKREAIELARTSGKPVTELAPRFSCEPQSLLHYDPDAAAADDPRGKKLSPHPPE